MSKSQALCSQRNQGTTDQAGKFPESANPSTSSLLTQTEITPEHKKTKTLARLNLPSPSNQDDYPSRIHQKASNEPAACIYKP